MSHLQCMTDRHSLLHHAFQLQKMTGYWADSLSASDIADITVHAYFRNLYIQHDQKCITTVYNNEKYYIQHVCTVGAAKTVVLTVKISTTMNRLLFTTVHDTYIAPNQRPKFRTSGWRTFIFDGKRKFVGPNYCTRNFGPRNLKVRPDRKNMKVRLLKYKSSVAEIREFGRRNMKVRADELSCN